jgi:phosphoribosyl-ATP pyrophosphohydrolase/phosphoribosyl-AMP cyclohydrolase
VEVTQKYKKIIPFIRFKNETVYIGEHEITETVENLCKSYDDGGADAVFILDDSQSQAEHEQVLASIKKITSMCIVPIITGGKIHHIDDIKKYLYAGASEVVFCVGDDYSLMEEGQKRFGTDRIGLFVSDSSKIEQIQKSCPFNIEDMLGQIYLHNLSNSEHNNISNNAGIKTYVFAASLEVQEKYLQSFDGILVDVDEKNAGAIMEKKHAFKEDGIFVDVFEPAFSWTDMKLNTDKMIPVIVQDYQTDEVLMLAYMNQEAYENTVRTGRMTYYSRSRNELWVKGETSGHYQYVKTLKLDCDNDTILAQVSQVGAACHTGNKSCFYREIMSKGIQKTNPLKVFEDVFSVIQDRKIHPKEGSYTNYLYEKGLDKILKKVGEEATEIVIAAKNPEPEETTYEISDFLYHVMVLMAEKGITWEDVTRELANR